MKDELHGWLKLLRFLAIWCFAVWAWTSLLGDVATFCALPQGPVLQAIIWLLTVFWLAPHFVRFIEQRFFGHSPMYDDTTPSSTTTFRSSSSPFTRSYSSTRVTYGQVIPNEYNDQVVDEDDEDEDEDDWSAKHQRLQAYRERNALREQWWNNSLNNDL